MARSVAGGLKGEDYAGSRDPIRCRFVWTARLRATGLIRIQSGNLDSCARSDGIVRVAPFQVGGSSYDGCFGGGL